MPFPGKLLGFDFSLGYTVTLVFSVGVLVLDREIPGLGYACDPKEIAARRI